MTLIYDNLWKILIDKKMKRTDLVSYAGISTNTLAKLGKNQSVSMDSLERICSALDCGVGDILEIRKNGMRYSAETEKKSKGVVYTPAEMADYLSGSMLSASRPNGGPLRILDPAMGEGELLVSLLKNIREISDCRVDITGYEIDEGSIDAAKKRIGEFQNINFHAVNADFIEKMAKEHEHTSKFDYIIANPPYIRTQIMGSETSRKLSKDTGLKGRADIYYVFLIYAQKLLSPEGIAGFITSNKFMSVKAGASVREYLMNRSEITQITDFGDTKPFEAAVLPCIIVFRNGKTDPQKVNFISVYERPGGMSRIKADSIFSSLRHTGDVAVNGKNYFVNSGSLSAPADGGPWTVACEISDEWMSNVEKRTFFKFKDIGKVRVVIKTTADPVFIKDMWPRDEGTPELLRPLITHRNSGQIVSENDKKWEVLYPHTTVGGKKTVSDLKDNPKSMRYLCENREKLESRKYVTEAGREWYEIWVPQNPDSWKNRKIVFRDISEEPQFWLDDSGAVVNGDCYWMDIYEGTSDEMIYLALAVANSRFIERFYDSRFNNKLYSGKRRFMAQYVELFPIPDPCTETAKRAASLVRDIIDHPGDPGRAAKKAEIDRLIEEAFTLS